MGHGRRGPRFRAAGGRPEDAVPLKSRLSGSSGNQDPPWPARRSVFDERWLLRLTGLLSQRDTGATKSRRRSYFFMNNTLPSRADCVRNAEKKYLQSWRNECATSLQYRRKALGRTWRCTLFASVAGVLAK